MRCSQIVTARLLQNPGVGVQAEPRVGIRCLKGLNAGFIQYSAAKILRAELDMIQMDGAQNRVRKA